MVQTAEKENQIVIAVSAKDVEDYGCPYCGGIYGYSNLSGQGATVWNCSDCGQTSLILAAGITESPIGIGDYHPTLQEHPRRKLGKIDREVLQKERKEITENDEAASLSKWLSIGFGQPLKIKIVGHHTSKSQHLPIIAAGAKDSNVKVTWFGQNYYFHFLGVEFKKTINGLLLYPISTMFGSYALSGHVNIELAPPLRSFEKAYFNQSFIKKFGADCGHGFMSALVVRYLQEVSKIDIEKLLDVCLRNTRYGETESIDGNAIEFKDLISIIGFELADEKNACSFDVNVAVDSGGIFEKIKIDWFDTELGESSVHVTLKEGCLLPTLPMPPKTLFVDPLYTVLDKYLPDAVHKRPPRKSIDPKIIKKLPVNIMEPREISDEEYHKLQNSKYPANYCYAVANLSTRDFTINVSNVLDAALTAFFLIKVLDPVVKMMLSE